MKTIAYFPQYTARNSKQPLAAFLSSLQRLGITAEENSYESDAVIIWSVLWHGAMAKNQTVYHHYRSLNKPVIVIDVGTLKRNITWKVAIDNISRYGYYGHLTNQDPQRPKKLGLELSAVQKKKPHVLVAAQHAKSLQVQDLNSIEQWISDQITLVSKYTDRPIIVRPHPRSELSTALLPRLEIQVPQKISSSYDSFDFDFGYHSIINYNSGPGILAAMGGADIIVDVSSLAWPVSYDIALIDNPPKIDRQQWLIDISHTEYTLEDLQNGLWFIRLEDRLIA